MVCHIETCCEPDGGWVAKVLSLPGLQIYGHSQEDALATARRLTAMLLLEDEREERKNQRIRAFYPGHAPDSHHASASP
jgi:predicted RNase H-like HicB family nuclease